jgi:hypothetical protein
MAPPRAGMATANRTIPQKQEMSRLDSSERWLKHEFRDFHDHAGDGLGTSLQLVQVSAQHESDLQRQGARNYEMGEE